MCPYEVLRLGLALARFGVKRYVLQEFRRQGCVDAHLVASAARGYLDDDFYRAIAGLFDGFEVRRV